MTEKYDIRKEQTVSLWQEQACEHCGDPIYQGDDIFYIHHANEGGDPLHATCSKECGQKIVENK